jgi:hypothetical protein
MDDQQEFTVRDRRRPGGETVPERPAEEPGGEQGTGRPEPANQGHDQTALPEVDFATFILSLATSAQISLGAIPHPETNESSVSIPGAKQMIDVLGMLKEKTKGNLSKEEENLIDQVLFNLRMHFVRVTEEQEKAGRS